MSLASVINYNIDDVARAGQTGAYFQLQSATVVEAAQVTGPVIDIQGGTVRIANIATCNFATDFEVSATGAVTATPIAVDTDYHIYVISNPSAFPTPKIVLSQTAPAGTVNGILYLSINPTQPGYNARYVGKLRTSNDGAGHAQCLDNDDARHIANYYNRAEKQVFKCANYANDGADTTYTSGGTAGNWRPDSNSSLEFCTFEEAVDLTLVYSLEANANNAGRIGLSLGASGAEATIAACANDIVLLDATGSLTINIFPATSAFTNRVTMSVNSAAAITFYADFDNDTGANADVPATYITGTVWI